MDLMGKFDRSVSMLAWGYNEEELIEGFLDQAFALLEKNVVDYELVFIDDCSTDRTGQILADYARREPRLRVITHETNLNVGFACRRAASFEFDPVLVTSWSPSCRGSLQYITGCWLF